MKATLSLLALLLLPAAALALSVDDVIELSKAGVSADVIVHKIDASDDVFELSNEDIIRLKDAGVNDRVIMRMIDTERERGRYEDDEGEDDDRGAEEGGYRYDRDVDWDVHLGLGYYQGYGSRWYDYTWFPYAGYLYGYTTPWYYYPHYRPHYRWGHPARYRHVQTKRFDDAGRTSWGRGSTRVKGHSAGTAYRPGASGRRGAPATSPGGSYRSVQRKSAPPAYAPPPSPTRSSAPPAAGSGSGRTVTRKK